MPNMLPPIYLDVSQGWETWGGTQPATLDLVVSINMMHISELRCTEVSGAPGGVGGSGAAPCIYWGARGEGCSARGWEISFGEGVPGVLIQLLPLSFPRGCSRAPGCC